MHSFFFAFINLDDGDGEDYDDSSADVGPSQKQSNSVDLMAPKPYFKLEDYTKTAKVGENVTLKCDVGNVNRKFLSRNKLGT